MIANRPVCSAAVEEQAQSAVDVEKRSMPVTAYLATETVGHDRDSRTVTMVTS